MGIDTHHVTSFLTPTSKQNGMVINLIYTEPNTLYYELGGQLSEVKDVSNDLHSAKDMVMSSSLHLPTLLANHIHTTNLCTHFSMLLCKVDHRVKGKNTRRRFIEIGPWVLILQHRQTRNTSEHRAIYLHSTSAARNTRDMMVTYRSTTKPLKLLFQCFFIISWWPFHYPKALCQVQTEGPFDKAFQDASDLINHFDVGLWHDSLGLIWSISDCNKSSQLKP